MLKKGKDNERNKDIINIKKNNDIIDQNNLFEKSENRSLLHSEVDVFKMKMKNKDDDNVADINGNVRNNDNSKNNVNINNDRNGIIDDSGNGTVDINVKGIDDINDDSNSVNIDCINNDSSNKDSNNINDNDSNNINDNDSNVNDYVNVNIPCIAEEALSSEAPNEISINQDIHIKEKMILRGDNNDWVKVKNNNKNDKK